MPRESTSLRLSTLTKSRIARIGELLDAKPAQVVDEAVIHYLATLEKGEPAYRLVPSEHPQERPREPQRGA